MSKKRNKKNKSMVVCGETKSMNYRGKTYYRISSLFWVDLYGVSVGGGLAHQLEMSYIGIPKEKYGTIRVRYSSYGRRGNDAMDYRYPGSCFC